MSVSVLLSLFSLVGLYTWIIDIGHNTAESTPIPVATPTPTSTADQVTGPVEVTDDIQRGIVLITGETATEGVAGTGMILTPDGLVVTNYHVVRSTEQLTATVAATGASFTATLVGRDATADVALLRLSDASALETVTVDHDPVIVGDMAIAAGNANGQGFVSANQGNVVSLSRSIQVAGPNDDDPTETLTGLIETNAAAYPGDSGGPMFDADHEVLGMTTAGNNDDDVRHVYAVPIADALAVVDQIRSGDESGHVVIGPKAFLGVAVDADADGLHVTQAEPESPAWAAGVRQGDRIVSLDGRLVDTRLELSRILDGLEPGSTASMEWETNGTVHEGAVTVSASPVN